MHVSSNLIFLQGNNIAVRRYVSPSCASKESLYALSASNKYRWRVPDVATSPIETKTLSQVSQTFSPPSGCQRQESVDSTIASSRSRESSRETWKTANVQRQYSGKPSLSRSQAARSSFSEGEALTEEDILSPDLAVEQEVSRESTDGGSWNNEFYPMGYCCVTQYEQGWLDLGCGDSITIDINYFGHNHDPSVDSKGRQTPSEVRVEIDAPVVYLRVYGFFARDLLCLKVILCTHDVSC